jgi:isoleucyl-tRNA synthetase
MKKTRAKLLKMNKDEMLALAMEEAGELIIELNKTRRFGSMNWHPDDPDRTTNRERIRNEFNELQNILDVWFERSAADKYLPSRETTRSDKAKMFDVRAGGGER